MSTDTSQVFKDKASPFSEKTDPVLDADKPTDVKDNGIENASDPTSLYTTDFVIETTQKGDFLAVQDGTQFVLSA